MNQLFFDHRSISSYKILSVRLLILSALLFNPFLSFSQDSTRTIIVGCDYAYYPYEFINENHEADGFDIDIIKAIGQELNVNVDIQAGNWFKIKKELENGEIDIIAGMYYLPDRAEKVNFSMPFIIITHSIFVKEGDFWKSLKDVRDEPNLKVVVENSSILHKYLTTAGISSNRIIPVENQLDALKILSETPNSCALLPDLQGKYIANKNGFDNIVTVGLPILPREYSIAINKNDSALLNQVNDAITKINQNGQYEKIYNKWFGDYNTQSPSFINLSHLEILFTLFIIGFLLAIFYMNRKYRRIFKSKSTNLNEEIHNKQKIQNRLNKSETLLRKITENTPYPIAMADSDGTLTYVNRLFEDNFGYTKKEIKNIDQWIYLFFKSEENQKKAKLKLIDMIEQIEADVDLKEKSTDVLTVINKKKEEMNIIIQVISLGDGQMLFFFENVTETVTYEEELKTALTKAETADMQKSSILANISHEIRTPMNSILGFSSLLAEDELDPEDKTLYNRLIKKNGHILLLLIQDIIDFSKIEVGDLNIYPQIVNLTDVVNQTFASVKEDYGVKIPEIIQFKLELPHNIEHTKYFVRVDSSRLNQILVNLLTYAFKYTDKGNIEFGFYDLENTKIRVYIKDSGKGLNKEQQELIFNKYSEIGKNSTQMSPGTGLGLAIAYQILKLFGSHLHIESKIGEGSTYYFDLNFYEGQGEKVETNKTSHLLGKTENYNWEGKTILIIEDNKENANYISAALKKTRCHVIIKSEVKEAIKTLQKDPYIDAVVLDWVLEDGSGAEVVQYIKKKLRNLPIVVVTALALLDEKVEILSYNVDAYFAKPVERKELLEKINELIITNN